jgi:hypothetical protein
LSAQQRIDDVDFQYDKFFLEGLVQEQIDEYRQEKSLPVLKKDAVLTTAANDHTLFMLKTGRVSHDQPSAKKRSPFDRVMFYDGMHGNVQENCYKVAVGSFVKLPGEVKKTKLKSYQNVAKAIAQNWIKSKEGAIVLANPKYVNYGVSAMLNEKDNSLIITHLLGSEPFVLPEGVKPMTNDFGILPYDKSKCSELTKKYAYLPQLMSDNIFFKNGEIYFYFHDLALLNAVLGESGDAIALDIISKDQFSCDTGNKFYPSKVHKGVMMPPVGKSQLFGKNEVKDGNEVEVSLGPIPSFVDTNNVEFNLLIIKENCLCQTVVYNSLGGENLQSLDLNFMMDTLSVSSRSDSVMNQLKFVIPFQRNKYQYNDEDIKPFLDSVSLNRFDLKSIEIIAYSSLEGGVKGNEIIQQKRAKSILAAIKKYKLQDVETKITTKENWDGFYQAIKGSPYEENLSTLPKEELRKKINEDSLKIALEPYLAQQRKAEIILTVEQIYMDEALFSVLPEWFEKAVVEKDYVKAKVYQSVMLKNVGNGNITKEQIIDVKIPRLKETVPFLNNQIALKWYSSKIENKDSLHLELFNEINTLLSIDETNSFLKYNQSVLRLLLWSSDYKREQTPRVVLREIKLLASTNIEAWMINRLVLNYNIIAADYFYDNKLFPEREKALINVKKALFSSNLDRDQSFRIANYFMFQLRIDWAIEIMKPFAIKKDIDEEFLFTFLTVAIYNKEKVPQDEYEALMIRAKELNKERFCKLFGFPNMSFQLLQDIPVKTLYCETCN